MKKNPISQKYQIHQINQGAKIVETSLKGVEASPKSVKAGLKSEEKRAKTY